MKSMLKAGAFLLFISAAGPVFAQSGAEWRKLYLSDLEAARAVIAANHPGMVDAGNPDFAKVMRSAYDEALASAEVVNSYNSYRLALTRFGNRFQDAHLGIGFTRPFDDIKEAGVYAVYQNETFVVREVHGRYGPRGARLRGAILRGCGGRPAGEVFRERVLPWWGRPAIKADWYQLAPLLLVDYGPPTRRAPESCRFLVRGRPVTLPLKWVAATYKEVDERVRRLTSFEDRPLNLERLEGGRVLWVNVPTFSVNEQEEVAAMRALVESLRSELAANRRWRLLVFDLRGNSGGDSRWGAQMASAVFGEEWADDARRWLGDGVYTEWRVSADHVAALRGIVRQQEQRFGADSEGAKYFRAFADSMQEALQQGKALISDRGAATRQGASRPKAVAVPGRVVLLTSASCFSACLDFLDRMRLHPSVVQAGQPTGVDTIYMENWTKNLPSGMARIGWPMKVYRNRRRGNNQSYAPHVPYDGPLGDTSAVRDWLIKRYR